MCCSVTQLGLLEDSVDQLVMHDLAPSTLSGARTMWRSWLEFCTTFSLPHLFNIERQRALAEQVMCCYAVFLTQSSLTFNTVRTYCVTGVTRWHSRNFLPFSIDGMIKLRRLLQALKRLIPPKLNPRLPITVELLLSFSSRANPNKAVDCCFMAMCTLMIYACRRLGELAYPSIASFKPEKHLTRACVSFPASLPNIMLVVFPTLKNRPHGPPLVCPVPRMAPRTVFCAYTWMQNWLSASNITDPLAPLFQRVDSQSGLPTGQPLLKPMFIKHLQQQVRISDPSSPAHCFTGHSFRIAAATILGLMCGGLPSEIMTFGDWSSECYAGYVQAAEKDRISASAKVGNVFVRGG